MYHISYTHILQVHLHTRLCHTKTILMVQLYAATSKHEENEVEDFYQEEDKVRMAVPKKDILVVLSEGYMKVCRPEGQDRWTKLALTVAKPTQGLRLLELVESQRLTLADILSPSFHEMKPLQGVVDQTDLHLVPKGFKSNQQRRGHI